jgi:hypothetical protein
MAERKVKIWFDREGDYLEVLFDQAEGFFRETGSDQVMEKVDAAGKLLGFSIMRVSSLSHEPLEVAL